MYFYFIVALQGFCIYHLFKNRNDYYWIFLIIFLPLIGCIIYLITQVYNKRDAEKITNEIATIINPTKKIKDLEKELEFSETFQNKVNLADAYFELGDYRQARDNYLKAQDDNYQLDVFLIKQLVKCFFRLENYVEAVNYSEKIKNNGDFKKSKAQFFYGLALKELGRLNEAESQLRVVDQRYSNYEERLVLAKFLNEIGKNGEARDILKEIQAESLHMTSTNRKKYRATIQEVALLLNDS